MQMEERYVKTRNEDRGARREERGARKHPEEERILAGGQGRTDGDIQAAANFVLVCLFLLLAMICVVVLGGCARPTAYVPVGEDIQTGGRDARGPKAGPSSASERPDRPHWEELRKQIGGL
jgi:hypothetical protein